MQDQATESEIREAYRRTLPTLLRRELFKSRSYADFIEWFKSDDRMAKHYAAIIRDNNLREEAHAIIAQLRAHYADDQHRFEVDRQNWAQ